MIQRPTTSPPEMDPKYYARGLRVYRLFMLVFLFGFLVFAFGHFGVIGGGLFALWFGAKIAWHWDPAAEESREARIDAYFEREERKEILGLVDDGRLSATTAEVVLSVQEYGRRRKLLKLARRNGWDAQQATEWVRANVKPEAQ